jgi:N-acetylglucosaminyldiphosphoundecaprenol N-acetyl-beta-D-mannosaminyltransferase
VILKNDSLDGKANIATGSLPAFNLIGTKVNPLSHEQILAQMDEWVCAHSTGHTVVVANTHVVMESHQNPSLGQAVRAASLVIPDGMPLVVVARLRGFPLKSRADGPGLMLKAFSEEPYKHWRHYYYGGTLEVLASLRTKFPDTTITGASAPPFRPLTPAEDAQVVAEINAAQADILWVGLGCPKQEIWMLEHANRLNVPVLLGVGQAFDILAGVKSRAPSWMQNTGLEWLYRLIREPKRLWKRYLVNNSLFLYYLVLEQIGVTLRKYKIHK